MADRPWRTSLGLMAVLFWSGMIGVPVLLFHLKSWGLDFGEHLHAATMFIASQALVFWLAARPPRTMPRTAPYSAPNSVTPVATEVPGDGQVWEAELVTPTNWETSEIASIASPASAEGCTTKLIIANYLGSSRPRVVHVEPGGTNCTLLPGQELEVTAKSHGPTPAFRIVESDIATQVYVDGEMVTVTVTTVDASVYKVVAGDRGAAPELRTQR